jgi:DNA polymerase/3'-5' exonuclease PolX
MRLDLAADIAESLCIRMAPHCVHRPEVLGSILRGVPNVKDIEILATPRWEERPDESDLLGGTKSVNLLHEWAERERQAGRARWIKTNTAHIVPVDLNPKGRQWKAILGGNLKLDLFLAGPDNYGPIKLIRTGSKEFSHAVMVYAKQHTEYRFDKGYLWKGEKMVQASTEEKVFALLRLKYLPPSERTSAFALKPA